MKIKSIINWIKNRSRRVKFISLSVICVLLLLRIIFPIIFLNSINEKLQQLDGFYGEAKEIDLALYRAGINIDEVLIKMLNKNDSTEYFTAEKIKLSIYLSSILSGKLKGKVEFDKPVLNFVNHKTFGEDVDKSLMDLVVQVRDITPVNVDKISINNGTISFIDKSKNPDIKLQLNNVELDGKNLYDKPTSENPLPSEVSMKGNFHEGEFTLKMNMDLTQKTPAFNLRSELSNTQLKYFNDVFKSFLNFDVERGELKLTSEFELRNNKFDGYVEPVLKDVKILQISKEEGNPLQIIWESFVGLTTKIFTNYRTNKIGSKIKISGEFSNPDVNLFQAFFSLLKHAFIEALNPVVN